MLDEKKAAIAKRVEKLMQSEESEEDAVREQEKQAQRIQCESCAVYGCCELVRCGLKGE